VIARRETETRVPCPLGACDGSGWILGPEDVARACECRSRIVARARTRGVASVIPAKYRGVSFDRPPVTEINDAVVQPVRDFCEEIVANLENGRGLWLYGGAGTGKTTLAMLVSRIALEAGRSVAIYSLPKLLARIRRTYDAERGEQSYAELFDRLTTVDLLHIDDLGAEKQTDWVLEQLYALINERYESRRSLVVTTNKNAAELDDQIGGRVVSRLVEMCEVVPVFGEDRRWQSTPPADVSGSLGEGSASALGPLDH
jgi:DNA replication protein DnaC